jgi:hypothetical protein
MTACSTPEATGNISKYLLCSGYIVPRELDHSHSWLAKLAAEATGRSHLKIKTIARDSATRWYL